MLYNFYNFAAIVIGALIGLVLKKGIPERLSDTILKSLGLATIYIGMSSALKGENTIIIISSLAVGSLFGELIDLDNQVNKLGSWIQSKVKKVGGGNFSQGFVSASILFCAGAMGIVGSIEAGLQGNGDTLTVKAMLDGITAIVFAASLGSGVVFSSIPVFLYQAIFVVGASLLTGVLNDASLASISSIGGIIIIGIGLNLVLDKKLKIANMSVAVFIPIILAIFGIH